MEIPIRENLNMNKNLTEYKAKWVRILKKSAYEWKKIKLRLDIFYRIEIRSFHRIQRRNII